MTWIGRTVAGRYAIQKPLSEGGMGDVWLAKDVRIDRLVVLKVPKAELLENPRFRVRFQREVDALRSFQHPHIVPILDTGEIDGTPFLAMPFLPGKSLADRLVRLPGHRQDLKQVLAWLTPIAEALDHLHSHGLVHRDVKPGNILFDAHGTPLLTDFGIAVAHEQTDPEQRLTQTAMLPGTPAYMAPEQALKGELSGAADQYALAVAAYEALVGELPFRGGTPLEVLVNKRAGRWVLPPGTSLPPHVTQALRRALSGDPAKRFRSCASFAHAMAVPAPTTESPRLPAPPLRRWLKVLALPTALLLLAGLGAFLWLRSRENPGPPREHAALEAATAPPASKQTPAPSMGPGPAGTTVPAAREAPAPVPPEPPAVLPPPPPSGETAAAADGGPKVSIDQPEAGLATKGQVRARGRITPAAAATRIYVNGEEVEVKEGGWEAFVSTGDAPEGPFEIAVGLTPGQPVVRRTILLDRTPPEIEITTGALPSVVRRDLTQGKELLLVPDVAEVLLALTVVDSSVASCACDGRPVPMDAAGTAQLLLELGSRHVADFTLEAHDRAGLSRTRKLTLCRAPRAALAWPVGWTTRVTDDVSRAFLRTVPLIATGAADGFKWRLDRVGVEPSYISGGLLARLPFLDPESREPVTTTIGSAEGRQRWVPLGEARALFTPGGADAPEPSSTRLDRDVVLCPLAGGKVGFLQALDPPLTIEGWLRLYQASASADLYWGLGTSDAECRLISGVVSARYPGGTGSPSRTLSSSERAGWLHVALFVGTGKLELFVNGKLIGSALSGPPQPGRWRPGMGMCGSTGASQQAVDFSGWNIDVGTDGRGPVGWRQVRLSTGRRYPSDFTPSPKLQPDATTAALYDFGALVEGAWWPRGTVAAPVVPYGWSVVAPADPKSPGLDLCADMNGGTAPLYTVPNPPGNATLEAWVRGVLDVGNHIVVSTPHLDLCIEGGMPVVHSRARDMVWQSGLLTLRDPHALDRGRWTHLACTREGSRIRLFVDGLPTAEGRANEALDAQPGPYPVCIGGCSTSDARLNDPQLVGQVDDVRLSEGVRYAGRFRPVQQLARDESTLFLASFHPDDSALRSGSGVLASKVLRTWPVGGGVLLPSGR